MISCTESAERKIKANQLRKEKLTYKAIGNALGVTATRARQMVYEFRASENTPPDELDGLSTRAKHTLKANGYTTREKIILGLACGKLSASNERGFRIPNYGKLMHAEICAWASMEKCLPSNESTIHKYKDFLEKHGYSVTKNEVAE